MLYLKQELKGAKPELRSITIEKNFITFKF